MSRKPIAVAGGLLLLVCGIALARQDAGLQLPPGGPVPGIPPLGLPIAPTPISPTSPPVAPKPSAEPTLDELLASLEKLRGEKAELEKKEQELVKVIQKKATEQKVRMEKLGLSIQPAMPPIPIVPVGGTSPR